MIANCYRYINLTLKSRREKEEQQRDASSRAAGPSRGGSDRAQRHQRSHEEGEDEDEDESTALLTAEGAVTHSPSFLLGGSGDTRGGSGGQSSENDEEVPHEIIDLTPDDPIFIAVKGIDAVAAPSAIGCSGGGGVKKRGKNKKKQNKRLGEGSNDRRGRNQRIAAAAIAMAPALNGHGCAVCDQFLSHELVVAVRGEIVRLEPHYKNSEIWVGKDSDIGAQMTVPRVR